jgi:hypothetical protein
LGSCGPLIETVGGMLPANWCAYSQLTFLRLVVATSGR